MSEMKHAEGPWSVSNDPGDWNVYPYGNGISCYQAIRAGNTIVGFAVARSRGFVEPDTRANAHLIAAAPTMHAALLDCRRALEIANFTQELAVVDAALSKAAPKGDESNHG